MDRRGRVSHLTVVANRTPPVIEHRPPERHAEGGDIVRGQADRFEREVLPHVDALYNLARWLTGNDADAEDVLQEACLRAFRSLSALRGQNARPWLFAIVRNACFSALGRRNEPLDDEPLDELRHATPDRGPEANLLRAAERDRVHAAIAALPPTLREAIVLREFEGLSYRELAEVLGTPIGTVMSRLARARERLLHALEERP